MPTTNSIKAKAFRHPAVVTIDRAIVDPRIFAFVKGFDINLYIPTQRAPGKTINYVCLRRGVMLEMVLSAPPILRPYGTLYLTKKINDTVLAAINIALFFMMDRMRYVDIMR